MTSQEYFAIKDRASASLLKRLAQSPAHAKAFLDGLFEETAAQATGSLKHLVTLEPRRLETEVAVYPGRRAGKVWEAFEADNAAKTIVTASELADAKAAAASIRRHPVASKLLAQGKPEVSLLWSADGTPAKSRIDWLSDSAIVDLKFTRDSSPTGYPREASRYGLPLQAAFYTDAVREQTGLELPFFVIACEPAPVYAVTVFSVPPEVIELGRQQYERGLKRLAECRAMTKPWPAYSEEVVTLALPAWAFTEEYES
jgi:exodeoxyribonuclease VIII